MANIDAGTYFFTAAAPVCNEGFVEHDGVKSSPIHVVREVLETLPTALQSHATEEIGLQSPFARNLRTHFARLVVLDQPAFNGRDPSDALLNAITGTNLLDPQPVDQLSCPYILVAIDFDLKVPNGASDPRAYLEELWEVMPDELRSIFQYCYGFQKVHDAATFASFLLACQIETTLPFHDYWYLPPKLPSLSIPTVVALVAAGPVIALLLGLAAWFGWIGWIGWGWTLAIGLLVPILMLLLVYRHVMRMGRTPYPATPGSSLRHVLKSLYLQQAFTGFAIAQQGTDPSRWGAEFRAFLDTHRPLDIAAPTQPPGVIRSRRGGETA